MLSAHSTRKLKASSDVCANTEMSKCVMRMIFANINLDVEEDGSHLQITCNLSLVFTEFDPQESDSPV